MDHDQIRLALAGYLDDSLEPNERAVVEAHLKSCDSCAASLRELRKVVDQARRLDMVDSPPWLTQTIMARVKERAEKKKPARAWFLHGFPMPVQALAVVFLAVTVFILYRSLRPGDQMAEQPAAQSRALAPDKIAPSTPVMPQPPAVEAPRKEQEHPTRLAAKTQREDPPATSPIDTAPAKVPQAASPAGDNVPASATPEAFGTHDTGTTMNSKLALKMQPDESPERMLLIKIRGRWKQPPASIEQSVRDAGGEVISRETTSDAWVMTVQVKASKHGALLSSLRRRGSAEEKSFATDDGWERFEILIGGKKAAAGC